MRCFNSLNGKSEGLKGCSFTDYLVMCSDFRTLLFSVAIYFSIAEVSFGDASVTCVTDFNTTSGHYFNAFESSQITNKHAFGCANPDIPEVSSKSKVYRENHVIDLENDRAADIYLNINGIPHRTTDSLPHYEEYSYKFALLSEKDVIWLVSFWNMPNSSVSFKFFYSCGSQLIFRDDHEYRSLCVNSDRRNMNAQNLYNEYKENIFVREEITSFSQIESPRVAAINVTVGPKQGASETWHSNFTSNCNKLKKDFESPLVSINKYEPSHQSLTCRQTAVPQDSPGLGKCFIIDIRAKNVSDDRKRQFINLEVVANSYRPDKRTVVVLRSNKVTLWQVHIASQLRKADIKLVYGSNDVLEGEDIITENLNYDDDVHKVLTRSIESQYDCAIVSYTQYDSPTELVFLSLSESDGKLATTIYDPDSLTDKAHVIYQESAISCPNGDWTVMVPVEVLERYGLSAENVEMGIGSSTCYPNSDDTHVSFTLMDCELPPDDTADVEFKVIFRTQGEHLLPSRKPEEEFVVIPMHCSDKNRVRKPIVETTCEKDTFFIEISDEEKKYLNVSGISKCEQEQFGHQTVYAFEKYSGENCGATFRDGTFRITIPTNSTVDGVSGELVEFSCTPFEVSTHYDLQVFKDYNMRNSVPHGPILVQDGLEPSDETTYHFKLTLDSNDHSLMVYISQCSLKRDSRIVQILIEKNCLASSIVSFVRSQTENNAQHFAVNLGGIIQEHETLHIECEVSACSKGETFDRRIVKPPQCINLHGDGCSPEDRDSGNIRLALYEPDRVTSSIFKSSVIKNEDENTNSPTISDVPIMVILAFGAFIMGCIFIGLICCIDKCYKRKNHPAQRKLMKSNSDVGAECGSSRSTGSTKTNGSSFSPLFCLKNGKSASSSPTSSKDNLEMKPFIPPPTSDNQPQNTNIRLEKTAENTAGTEPSSSKTESSSTVTLNSYPQGGGATNGKRFLTPSVTLPHSKLPLCQASPDHTSLPCKIVLSQGTSLPPHDLYCKDQWTASPALRSDGVLGSCPMPVTQDEFHRLKEEAV